MIDSPKWNLKSSIKIFQFESRAVTSASLTYNTTIITQSKVSIYPFLSLSLNLYIYIYIRFSIVYPEEVIDFALNHIYIYIYIYFFFFFFRYIKFENLIFFIYSFLKKKRNIRFSIVYPEEVIDFALIFHWKFEWKIKILIIDIFRIDHWESQILFFYFFKKFYVI